MLLLFILFLVSLQLIVSMENPDSSSGSLLPELTSFTDFEPEVQKSDPLRNIHLLAQQMQSELSLEANFYKNRMNNMLHTIPSSEDKKILKEYLKKMDPKQSARHLLEAIKELTNSEHVNTSVLENVIAAIPSFKIKYYAEATLWLWESKTDDYKQQMLALLAQKNSPAVEIPSNHADPVSDSYGEYFGQLNPIQ